MNPQEGFLVESKQEELCVNPNCVQITEGELLLTKRYALGRNLSQTDCWKD